MSGIIEQQAIMDISSRLEKFKTIDPNKTYNFRCNICGDSDKNEFKTRAYFFYSQKDDIYMFKCHNCGVAYSFQHYMKLQFNVEYKELRKQIFKSRGIREYAPKVEKDFKVEDIFDEEYQEQFNSLISTVRQLNILQPLLALSKNSPARQYIDSRMIPLEAQKRLFYTDNFKEFISTIVSDKQLGNKKVPADPRIVFPLVTLDNETIGFQGRCIGNNSGLRFSIIKLAESYPKIFGLEYIDKNSDEPIIVLEGAMDSLFVDNSIALNGGDINSLKDIVNGDNIDPNRFIVVLDNEPRSIDTINRVNKAIEAGYRVLIWQNISPEFKDINLMMINKVFPDTKALREYIMTHNYSKTIATLHAKRWSKF